MRSTPFMWPLVLPGPAIKNPFMSMVTLFAVDINSAGTRRNFETAGEPIASAGTDYVGNPPLAITFAWLISIVPSTAPAGAPHAIIATMPSRARLRCL